MSFAEVVGQAGAKRSLQAALRTGRVAGGYLLAGPAGVGKFLTALAFVRALLCENPGDDACDACSCCRRTRSRVHPGLHVVGEGDAVTEVKIDEVREAQDRLSLKPLEGARQVVIVDNADLLNEPAGNALLKTLEEPPPGAVLLLVAAQPRRVLETVRSRCQTIRFLPLTADQVRSVLEAKEVPGEEAAALARFSGGSPGRALGLRRLGFPDRAETVLLRFLDLGRDDPVAIAADLGSRPAESRADRAAERLAIREVLTLLAHLARDAMVASTGALESVRTVPASTLDVALARFGRDPELWGKLLRRILEAAHNVRANVSVDLVLVDLLLDIECKWKRLPPRPSSRPKSVTGR